MSSGFNSRTAFKVFKKRIMEMDYLSMIIGLCLGVVVMGIICDKVAKSQAKQHKEEVEALKGVVSSLNTEIESLKKELNTQRNVVKTLSENNQRLLKSNQQLKKAEHPNDETITYMVSLYGNWFERSQEDYHLSPSEFIKKYWK